MTYRLKILYFILSLFFLSEILVAQSFITKTYTVNDGLPDNQVYDVVQDSSGKMWFATHSGVCSYDGEQWEIVGEKEKLNNYEYIRLKIDERGNLWALPNLTKDPLIVIHPNGKISIFQIGKDRTNYSSENSSFDIIYSKDKLKVIICSRNTNIFTFFENKWRIDKVEENGQQDFIYDVSLINENQFLVASKAGLFLFDWDKKRNNYIRRKILNESIFVIKKDIGNNTTEKIWLLGENFIGSFENNSFHLISKMVHLSVGGNRDYYFLVFDRDGGIYYGNGIISYFVNLDRLKLADKQTVKNIRSTFAGTNSVCVDYEGNVWMVNSRGVKKLVRSPFENFSSRNGLLEDEVTAISQLNDGTLVFGHNDGVTLLSGQTFSYYPFDESQVHHSILNRILDVCKDEKGNVFMASFKKGILKITDKNNLVWVKSKKNQLYFCVANDKQDNIIVGTSTEIFELNNQSHKYKNNALFNGKTFRRLYFTKSGELIIGTPRGLIVKNHLDVSFIQPKNLDVANVFSIFERRNKSILIGTKAGLFYVDSDSLRKFYENDFHIDRPVYFIIEDTKSNLWFGTDNGVFKWDGKNEEHFTTDDGLAGNETNRAAAFVDDEGNLWIGTDKGLSKYSAHQSEEKIVPPHVEFNFIEDVNHNKYYPQSHLILGENLNNLSFHYHGYSYIDESKNSYEISLINSLYNTTQKFMTKESVVWFNSLQPGSYNFFVRFRNAKGVWSKKSAEISFVVATPFYNRIWFYTSVIFLVSVFVFSTQHKLSELKKIRKKNESTARTSIVLETTENERKRITMDIHDGLGQILASAKMKLEVFNNKKNLDGSELDEAVNLILQAREEISKIINNLHPSEIEKYGLTNAIKIMCNEMNKNTSIKTECIVKNYSKIDKKNFEVMIYRIIQEALTNIIKHSDATNAKIIFDKSATFLSVVIKDDGKGFFFDGFENLNESSMGLINMYERVNSLGGKIFIRSQINSGTVIKIIIPV